METPTETIRITGLSAEATRTIDERATAMSLTAGEYLRKWIEEEHAEFLTPGNDELQKEKKTGD